MSIFFFFLTILLTLLITVVAARRTKSAADYYTADSRISGIQNGWAISGDFMSATTFLGLTAMLFSTGWDVSIFYLAPICGFALMLLLLAAPLRRLGKFTLGDVLETQLGSSSIRVFSGASTVIICLFYLVAQAVGAGALISVLFGLPFAYAVVLIAALMSAYVAFGGMLAATWVQITKAVILAASALVLASLAIAQSGGLGAIYDKAIQVHDLGAGVFAPGGQKMGLFGAFSLAFGLVFGMAGMPHLLIRFFTVPSEKEARKSVLTASFIVGSVFALLFAVVAPAAIAFVYGNPDFHTAERSVVGGPNMVVIHLAKALGGEVLLGVLSAVAFATILAVVAGLTIAVAVAAANDLYAVARRRGQVSEREGITVFRIACVVTAAATIGLAIVFEKENVAFLSSMAFSVAASTNFPILILALYWRRLTAAGAVVGGLVGLVSSIALIVLSPAIWVRVLGNAEAIFPSDYPALVTAPIAALTAMAVSLVTRSASRPNLASEGFSSR